MPCIRAWLQPCRWRQSIQGFSPRCLPPCHVRETIGELLGPLHQSRLHRVRRYVFPMLDEALPTLHARLGEATLPDLSPMTAFLPLLTAWPFPPSCRRRPSPIKSDGLALRQSREAGISWPLRRSKARRSSTWHSVPTATGRGLGWSWWWRRTYALNSGCCPEEHGVQVLPSPGAKAPFLSRFGTAEAMP